MLLIKILSDFRQIVLVYAGCELRELTGGQWRANPMESKGRQNPKSKDSLKGRSVWSIQKLRSKAKARHVTFLTASLKKRAEGYSIAQEPSFSLGAKNTIRARNCLGCAGDTGILLLLCKISTRLAREIERRLVKSKNKKKKWKTWALTTCTWTARMLSAIGVKWLNRRKQLFLHQRVRDPEQRIKDNAGLVWWERKKIHPREREISLRLSNGFHSLSVRKAGDLAE